jgi:hypothetical protein
MLERESYQQIDAGIREMAERYGAPIDFGQGLVLVSQRRKPRAGWRYSPLVHLVGRDDGHVFVHRLPATVPTVASALEYMEPQPVKRARRQGLPVQRQGDVFAVGRPKENQKAEYFGQHVIAHTRHRVIDGGRPWLTLRHDGGQHPDVILVSGYVWTLYRAKAVGGMGD